MNVKIDYCPKCGRAEKVDRNSNLKLCSLCFMCETDRLAMAELRESQRIDWDETLSAAKKEVGWKQADLAFWLKITPAELSMIRHGRRVMPKETFLHFQERFSKHIKYKELQDKKLQAAP